MKHLLLASAMLALAAGQAVAKPYNYAAIVGGYSLQSKDYIEVDATVYGTVSNSSACNAVATSESNHAAYVWNSIVAHEGGDPRNVVGQAVTYCVPAGASGVAAAWLDVDAYGPAGFDVHVHLAVDTLSDCQASLDGLVSALYPITGPNVNGGNGYVVTSYCTSTDPSR